MSYENLNDSLKKAARKKTEKIPLTQLHSRSIAQHHLYSIDVNTKTKMYIKCCVFIVKRFSKTKRNMVN